MKIAYFDCVFGVSGDMLIGSLLDAGLPLADLRRELAGLGLDNYTLARRTVTKGVMQATKFDVKVAGDRGPAPAHAAGPGHDHGPGHARAPDRPAAPAPALAAGAGAHGYVTGKHDVPLASILRRIATSPLPPVVRDRAQAVFRRIGEVEAKIHGVPVETVHFHEIGAVDSIVDVVGTATALHLLGIDAIYCSRFPQGWGTVDCRHGRLPLPGPATWELLKGFPVFPADVRGELCTPTGVGILTTLAQGVGTFPPMTVETVGYGAGDTDFASHPNVLRVLLGHAAPAEESDGLWQVETNLDDMTGQQVGYLYDRVFAAGAVEVFSTPVQMKKNRPGILLSTLVPPAALAAVERTLFAETTTFGVRRHWVERTKLAREVVTVATPLGPIRFKVGRRAGAAATVSPEYEDCRRIAEARGLPLKQVMAEAQRRAPAATAGAPATGKSPKPALAPSGIKDRKPRADHGTRSVRSED